MTTSAPLHCRPAAYALFAAQLPRLASSDALLRAAVAVAMHESPDASPDAVDQQIEAIAADVYDRLNRREPHAVLAHTHAVLFDEMRFTGDAHDFYNPRNSYLPSVLDRRRGIPVTLALVYKCVLERLGMRVVGVNAPVHFLAAVDLDASTLYVDPFHAGRSMTRDEALAFLRKQIGDDLAARDDLLVEATHAQWLARILTNLTHIFSATDRPDDAHAMIELAGLLREAT